MDEKSLDELLRRCREAALSSLPQNFHQNVQQEIRLRRALELSELGTFPSWRSLPLSPHFVTALLAVAMFVGIGLGSRQQDRIALSAKQALNLDVFGAKPPTLPSTVLSSNL